MSTLIETSKLGLGACLLSLSVAAAAQTTETQTTTTTTQTTQTTKSDEHHSNRGFMIGAGIYYGLVDDKVDTDSDFDFSDITIDDSSAAYNFMAGYRFNHWLAVDAGYWNLGEYSSDRFPVTGDKVTTEVSAWTLGGMVSVPLWIIDVYGRAGVAWWETDTKNGSGDDSTDYYYGLGAALNLGGSIDLYAEWVRFDLGSDVNTNIDRLGIGVRWTF
jgi:OmpA-OmpF porin, OOP family